MSFCQKLNFLYPKFALSSSHESYVRIMQISVV
ncbi:hypothetical protein T11_16611 [Trichinella zimbabwensis]|uniref:Uncharacterized protein n=1 Tax=Trichinella zimbabwensis TaxID=268475 RepID=A0A0V1DT59_9BILA|nr:hypothetical protein T11_14125 [Trichinella zimbabwensis]KRY64630.1 hypothetical protein T11_16611 [Trichinella zimbabwensis]